MIEFQSGDRRSNHPCRHQSFRRSFGEGGPACGIGLHRKRCFGTVEGRRSRHQHRQTGADHRRCGDRHHKCAAADAPPRRCCARLRRFLTDRCQRFGRDHRLDGRSSRFLTARMFLRKRMADVVGGPQVIAKDGFDAIDQRWRARGFGALLFQRATDGAQQFGLGRCDIGPVRPGHAARQSITIAMGARRCGRRRPGGCAIVKAASGPDIVHLRHISCT
ncbi:hypothetical protein ACVI1T_002675 [Rhizobium redzepovicii]